MSVEAKPTNIKNTFIDLFKQHKDELEEGLPDFINDKRPEALEAFKKLGIPTQKQEKYKYTDLSSAFEKKYRQYFQPKTIDFNVNDIFSCDVPSLESKNILLLNGWFYNREQPLFKTKEGVIYGSLHEAANKYPEIVREHYGQIAGTKEDSLTALNTAFAQDGFFLYIPRGVVLEEPFQLINLLMDEEPGMAQYRNLIVAEENSDSRIIICDHTLSQQKFLTNSVSEVQVDKNASLDIVRVQNEHNGATQLSGLYAKQEKDSNFSINTISLHGGLIRNDYNLLLNGEGCNSNAMGLYLTDRGQHIDSYVHIDHKEPHCTSNQIFKGVLDDFATGAFNGRILVRQDAQKTEAYQSNNNILLTDDATMNTKPQLEIYADDVKCSHGATVGQLDEEGLFYLRSRGINYKESQLLLMYAFAHEVIKKIKVKPLQDRIHGLVEKRLRGELSRCNYCEMKCG